MLKSSLQGDTGRRVEQLVAENAKLIRTVPANVATKLSAYIQEQQMRGRRSSEIMKDIAPQLSHLKQYEIRRIARTEVAKADTAVTQSRAESIGLNWYQWQTAEDGRVRDSHKHMDKVLVNWNDSPSPEQLDGIKSQGHYNAGNIYNCRCVCLPVVTLNEISFPAKVYSGGVIRKLSRNQFALLAGLQKQIAA
jgi:SPP1 gp7 family putative phage head morphogenesis protein